MWGLEDNRAISSDLVREQDFILYIRRLHRLETPCFILNLLLSSFEKKEPFSLKEANKRLEAFSKIEGIYYSDMSNGDAFLVWPNVEIKDLAALRHKALLVAFDKESIDNINALEKTLLKDYHLPKQYTDLRERMNAYIELSRKTGSEGNIVTPEQLLSGPLAHGHLTTWSVNQIENLFNKIALKDFVQTQIIYNYKDKEHRAVLRQEYSVNLQALKESYFPRLDLSGPNHLFLELCESIDHHLLTELTEDMDFISDKEINLNLSVHSVLGAVFAQFTHTIPQDKHSLIVFELHRGNLFQNFTHTLNAIETLRKEGFRVAIDNITLDMLPFINFKAFDVDYLKINVSRPYESQLDNPQILKTVEALPAEKIIFFHCETEKAFKIGLDLGIHNFQGWFLDHLVVKN